MCTISENVFFFAGEKKTPAGYPDSKTKVSNMSPNIPDPNRTKLYLKTTISMSEVMNIDNFQLNSLLNGVGGMAGGLKH